MADPTFDLEDVDKDPNKPIVTFNLDDVGQDPTQPVITFDLEDLGPTAVQNLNTPEQVDELVIMPSLDEFLEEIDRGLEITVKQLEEGGAQSAQEEIQFSIDRINQMSPQMRRLLGGVLGTADDYIEDLYIEQDTQKVIERQAATRALIEMGTPPESLGGGITRGVTRIGVYAAIAIPLLRGAGAGRITSSIVGGALADLAAFEGSEPRLSNMLAELNQPEVTKAVFEYLSADPNDDAVEQKFKQAIEGIILGGVGEGIARSIGLTFRMANGVRRKLQARLIGKSKGTQPLPRSGSRNPEVVAIETQMDQEATEIFRSKLVGKTLRSAEGKFQSVKSMIKDFEERMFELDPTGLLTPRQMADKVIAFKGLADTVFSMSDEAVKDGKAINQALKANREALEAANKKTAARRFRGFLNSLETSIVDRNAGLKRELLKQGGAEGRTAVMHLELAQGAGTAAQHFYREGWKQIYRGLGVDDRRVLDDIIMLSRISEIKKYQPNWQPPIDIPGVRGGRKAGKEAYDAALIQKRLEVGEEVWGSLEPRSVSYFEHIKRSIDVLLEGGVISKAEHKALGQFRYSPIQFLENLDPVMMTFREGPKTISVRSSGLQPLGRGDEKIVLTNTDMFLGQVLSRAHSRAARNRANQALFQMAKDTPDNGVVAVGKKAPKEGDWAQISVMIEGESKNMFLKKEFVKQWSSDPIAVSMASRVFSGSFLVRPFATGINPEFAFVNFPRDIMYSWLTAADGTLYSTNIFRGLGELTNDLVTVLPDAWGRKGRFEDYLKQGGGMNLMTHGAREGLGELDIAGKVSGRARALSEVQHVLGYLNETSEIWVRLAVRNRAIKKVLAEGKSLAEAELEGTWQGRRYLDFAQGGGMTKRIDGWIPYTNAGVQGLRGLGRAAANNPKIVSAKIGQVMGVYASVWYANHIVNPEAWKQVPDYAKNRNLIITTPFYRIDMEGNKRFTYYKIPIDHSTMPFKVLSDAMMERTVNGKVPNNAAIDVIASLTGPVPGIGNLPPSINAFMAIAANLDMWRNDQIWRGREGIPKHMERQLTGENPTSTLAVDIGRAIGPPLQDVEPLDAFSSPKRLEVATRSLIPQNVWTDMVGWGYKGLMHGMSDEQNTAVTESFMQQLAEFPFSRRFVSETHPLVSSLDNIRARQKEASGEVWELQENIKVMMEGMKKESGLRRLTGRNIDEVSTWIEKQPILHQETLATYATNTIKLDAIFKELNLAEMPGMPQRDELLLLTGEDVQTRAMIFMDYYTDAKEDVRSEVAGDRRTGRKKIRALDNVMALVPGFSSRRMALALEKVARERGVALPQ